MPHNPGILELMIIIDQSCREFIAKNIADLGKAILTVGFASYFFEKLPLILRLGFLTLGIAFFIGSVILYGWKGDGPWKRS